ncbi:hypothetical protein FG386_001692 [Cryptosporidium ryanae]|uniref:uncharacterized protein n=1 Tax=Cryptosporidium ryanae TaxID=515981 RepID=UPI00351A5CF0|nr:hypothetical protein FG386_001692 [Cryptosporidium ryanae]
MIHFFIIQNLNGKTIFSRWYNSYTVDKRKKVQEAIKERLSYLEKDDLSYFTLDENRVIFKKYPRMFFIAGVDFSENILMILATLQLINESFGSNSREPTDVDVIYKNKKLIKLMDEIILGGEIIGTSIKNIRKGVM